MTGREVFGCLYVAGQDKGRCCWIAYDGGKSSLLGSSFSRFLLMMAGRVAC